MNSAGTNVMANDSVMARFWLQIPLMAILKSFSYSTL